MRKEHSRHSRTSRSTMPPSYQPTNAMPTDGPSYDGMDRAGAPASRREARAARRAQSGGIKSVAVFLVLLLVFGGAGWAAYTMLVDHRNPFASLTDLGDSGPKTSLTIGLSPAPKSLDIRTQSGDAVSQALLGNVYETLLNRSQQNKPEAGIAKSWTTSDDGLTYTFHLNGGLTFSNGHTLDADDVVWSLQQTIQHKYVGADGLDGLASVKANGPTTVVITLNKTIPDLAWLLSGRAGIVYDAEAGIDYATQAVGSGPFTVKKWDAGSSLTLRHNPKYRGANAAKTGTITLRYYDNAGLAATAMAKGEVDAVPNVATDDLDTLRSHDDITLKQGDSYEKVLLGFNSDDNSLFSDAHVRQGARYALDNAALVKENGAAGELGGPISSLDPGYEDLTGLYPHDITKALSLLNYFVFRAPSEYRKMPNGPQIGDRPMKLVYPQRYGRQLGETIKEQLAQGDIPVDITMVDDATWQKRVVEKRDFDMTIFTMDSSHDVGDLVDPDLFLNYTSSKAEELYKNAQASKNDQEYEQRLKALARQVASDSPVDWLYVSRPWVAVRSGITGMPTNMVDCYLPLAGVAKG
ncbi:ABC transporter substrate-binding protein [Bifidobacterium sp. 82T24]|uniref:ABC transporter substrate-binding protein n=1 Tax=Bifidobacterium pluvialisilvae TaxID=2834436 RepID=UPI001C55F1E6|nr:ABC transporter substrate-binding protein [Bifidobacterium pluvialisilvae]MBW3087527.1 ABC transporter substrate-binding protein [Bifidobacterium pluvialisilvae]